MKKQFLGTQKGIFYCFYKEVNCILAVGSSHLL